MSETVPKIRKANPNAENIHTRMRYKIYMIRASTAWKPVMDNKTCGVILFGKNPHDDSVEKSFAAIDYFIFKWKPFKIV